MMSDSDSRDVGRRRPATVSAGTAWLILLLVFAAAIRVTGLDWGLPNHSLNLRTYHPDEVGLLLPMQHFNPSKLQFDPGRFGGGDLGIYITGALIKAGALMGVISLRKDRSYYEDHLDEFSKFFLAGRIYCVAFFLGALAALYLLMSCVFSRRAAFISGLILAIIPVIFIQSHFYYVHIPVLLPMFLSLACSISVLHGNRSARIHLGAGIFAGLAGAIGLYGLPIISALPAAMIIGREKSAGSLRQWQAPLRGMGLGLLGFGAGFLAGAPYAVLKYHDRIISIFKMVLMGSPSAGSPHHSSSIFSSFRYYIIDAPILGLGPTLYLFAILALAWLGVHSWQKSPPTRQAKTIALIAVISLVYYACTLFNRIKSFHYLLYTYSLAVILVGVSIDSMLASRYRPARLLAMVTLTLTLLNTGAYTFFYWKIFNLRDVRQEMSDNVVRTIPEGATIAVIDFGWFSLPVIQNIRQTQYHVFRLHRGLSAEEQRAVVTEDDARKKMTPAEEAIVWSERLIELKPDYLVVSSVERDNPEAAAYFSVVDGQGGYSPIMTMRGPLYGIAGYFWWLPHWKNEALLNALSPAYTIYQRGMHP